MANCPACPHCMSTRTQYVKSEGVQGNLGTYLCGHCGREWHEVLARSKREALLERRPPAPAARRVFAGDHDEAAAKSAPPPGQ